jgi:CRP-like cAMP-binding protein
MNSTLALINSLSNTCPESFSKLIEISEYRKIKSGTQLVMQGEITSKVYLLISGVVRCYLITESGKEYNKTFYLNDSLFGSLTALIQKKPSLFIFEALTDCKVYELEFCKLMELCKKDMHLNKLYTKVLEATYIKYEKRLIELITLDAKDRYLELKKQILDVDDLITQYHIASYLGITPVQLSRIRKKIDLS